MPLKQKEKKQLMVLGALIAVILVAVGYFYRDKLLPQPAAGGASYVPPQRIELPTTKTAEELFKREDFMTLKQFGSMPVTAPPAGLNNPFK